jgi:hypothetical protein
MDRSQQVPVNIKSSERYHTGQQHFPGGGPELPLIFHTHAERIYNEYQKQQAMNGAHYLYPVRVAIGIFQGNSNTNEDEQRDTFQKGYYAQPADPCRQIFIHKIKKF